MEEKKVWGIHTMDDHLFLKNNLIGIGWREIGDLLLIDADREAFKEKYKQIFVDSKPQAIPTCAGMLFRFAHEMQIGDYVVFPSKIDRMINLGIVEGCPLEISIDPKTKSIIFTPYYPTVSMELLAMADTLSSGYDPNVWDIADRLRELSKKLEEIENRG